MKYSFHLTLLKHYSLGLMFLLSVSTGIQGQKSEGGVPFSKKSVIGLKTAAGIPKVQLKALDIEKLLTERDTTRPYPTYGIFTDTLIDVKKSGLAEAVSRGGKIWRLRISNETAKSIQLFFRKYIVPEGAALFLYNDDQTNIAGAFTKSNMQRDSVFMIADFKGNHTIIEYYEPDRPEFEGTLVLGAIGQAYIDIFSLKSSDGFVNINCPVGKDAQLVKHAVCRMTFMIDSQMGYCSGSLINNVNQDGKPYFLTANHCLSSQTVATTLVTYFNYEVTGCDGELLDYKTLSGSTLLSTGQPSDYTLLLLNTKPTSEYQPFYAGWDITGIETDSVTGVHVPYQHTKKISIDYDSIYTFPNTIGWEGGGNSPVNSHWILSYDIGSTSGGSSGSPLFNKRKQIIGQLHGGVDDLDFYGKLSYSYTHKPATYPLIKTYLDPNATNVETLDGYAPADNIPDAFFTTDYEQVCYNAPIKFTDYSVFGPFDRLWSVDPPGFAFVEGTSAASANPVIQFTDDALYTVKLELSVNDEVKSSESMNIKAGKDLNVTVSKLNDEEICDCDFDTLQLAGNGADNFIWQIMPDDTDKITLSGSNKDTVTIKRIPDFIAESSYVINLKVIGTQATCSDTLLYAANIIKPSNDNIANAIEIGYGRSDTYSNVCGTDEADEPVPPNTSCTSQDSWCECLMGGTYIEDILDNSVWFKFIPLKTGNISISSSGFDNQIALYEAESYADLFAGNYVLLGANDDRSEADERPLIVSESVTEGTTYWIQVDGSACGAEGEFFIIINDLSSTGTKEIDPELIIAFPQPAHDILTIQNADNSGAEANLTIYNISGSCIYNKSIKQDGTSISINISSWESGIYFIMLKTSKSNYISKIIKE